MTNSQELNSLDFIFECDYGNRTPLKKLLLEILDKYDANTLPMIAVFINNMPYNLELFVVISFAMGHDKIIKEVISKFQRIDAVRLTDLTFSDLLKEQVNRRFNLHTIPDKDMCELVFDTQFLFAEKTCVAQKGYTLSPIGTKNVLFLSYSSKDKDKIEQLVPILNSTAIPIWYDKHCIDLGENLAEKIQEGMGKSIVVIFFVSQNFLKSNWCKTEMNTFLTQYASKRNITIITIKCGDVSHEELPLFLQPLKYVKEEDFNSMTELAEEILPTLRKRFSD